MKKVKSLSHVRLFVTPWTIGSPIHGIFQASVLERVALSFSRGSSQPREHTQVSRIVGALPSESLLLRLLLSRSVVSDSVRPEGLQPTRLLRPWDSPGKNTGVGCHFLLQWMKVKSESEVTQSCLTLSDPLDCACQALPSMGFSGQQYWSGVPLPSPLSH